MPHVSRFCKPCGSSSTVNGHKCRLLPCSTLYGTERNGLNPGGLGFQYSTSYVHDCNASATGRAYAYLGSSATCDFPQTLHYSWVNLHIHIHTNTLHGQTRLNSLWRMCPAMCCSRLFGSISEEHRGHSAFVWTDAATTSFCPRDPIDVQVGSSCTGRWATLPRGGLRASGTAAHP